MKLRLRAAGAVGTAVALTAGLLVHLSGPASATATPPYEPDTTNQLGTIALYDANGARVTSGSVTDSPLATYAVASTDDPSGLDNSAALYGYLPQNGVVPGNWSGEQLSGTTTFPVAAGGAVPTSISSLGTHRPVVTGQSGDLRVTDLASDYPHPSGDTGTAYDGLYQLRILTAHNTQWWAADIQISGSTWTQVYPTVTPTATTTTLAAAPASPAYAGQSVTVTATVTSGAAGTVQFKDGGNALGTAVTVASNQAQYTTSALAEGTHSLTAEFTPADPTSYAASTSNALSYSVLGAPAWRPVMYGAHRVGLTDQCLASFANNASVTYQWYVNGAPVSGATAAAYKVAETYYGKSLSCRVTATNPAGTQTALSTSSIVGIGPALVPTTRPTLSGQHHYGTYEYCNRGTWSPAATAYYYQWYVGTSAIPGATAYRYGVPKAYYGKYISCQVTVRRAAWTNGVYRTAGVRIT